MIDRVAEMATGNVWEKATQMQITQFLSIYSYSIAKQNHQTAIMKQEYAKMRSK